ncbi:MAG: uridine kinase [Deltaproteobacteria bacterium CG07_land_8_20_14_0_80_38_7]|nr:MAG: uridine kinase [Deltaproteobacteria bacterium CG07_land_8_20_14_0_80_38_7]
MASLVIGIAGGSGSGKTTIARKIRDKVGNDRITFIEMDCYYRDLSHLNIDQRIAHNFDHPSSIDIELFIEHIKAVKNGKSIEKPQYDFITHTRLQKTAGIISQPVVILEGILLYENPKVRELIDIKTYVEAPDDVRFIRRLMRDIEHRGRTPRAVVEQYYKTVRPMHETFAGPTREYADMIIPWHDYNEVAIDMVISRIEACLKERKQVDNLYIENKRFISEKAAEVV